MNRRQLIQSTSALTFLSTLGFSNRIFASNPNCDYFSNLLLGGVPGFDLANSTVSKTGQFHHYHFLHIPQFILDNPPAKWSTITSMMVSNLGMAEFFFRHPGNPDDRGRTRDERHKQFHCHKVDFEQSQLEDIAAGKETEVFAYIRGRQNHGFVFNKRSSQGISPEDSFFSEQRRIRRIAEEENLRFQKTNACYPVRVFESNSNYSVDSLEDILQLQSWSF